METLLSPSNFMHPLPADDHSPQQHASNLTRYQSLPTSFLESVVADDDDYPGTSNLDTEMINFFHSASGDSKYTNTINKEISNGNRSCLVRQTTSPAGLLSSLAHHHHIPTGLTGMNDVGNFRSCNNTNTGLSSTTNRSGCYMNFSSGPSSHSRFMPQSAANVNDNIGITDSYLKRNRDGEAKMLSNMTGLDKQNDDFNHYTSGLVHQLSLPSTSAEMASMENFLQFQQDPIPCKIRAKRGFATHPRSIAERVRRTRISARMKKLQHLFPNMDKQANTADMLDLAVVYIKDLQKEVQTLNKTRSRCTCPDIRK